MGHYTGQQETCKWDTTGDSRRHVSGALQGAAGDMSVGHYKGQQETCKWDTTGDSRIHVSGTLQGTAGDM